MSHSQNVSSLNFLNFVKLLVTFKDITLCIMCQIFCVTFHDLLLYIYICLILLICSDKYAKTEKQLKKGENFFRDILTPLAGLSSTWNYVGFKVFPNVESRKVFEDLGFTETETKVLKTTLFLWIFIFCVFRQFWQKPNYRMPTVNGWLSWN